MEQVRLWQGLWRVGTKDPETRECLESGAR